MNSNSRPSRFSELPDTPIFNKQSYFSKKVSTDKAGRPTFGEGEKISREEKGYRKETTTTTYQSPMEVYASQQYLISEAPIVNSRIALSPTQVVRTSPSVSRVHLSPPRTSILQGSRIVVGQPTVVSPVTTMIPPMTTVVPLTTSVLPAPTMTSVSPMVVRSQSFPSPTVTHIETIKESVSQETNQLQRLQTMNDFLTENYTLVYNKLKDLQNELSLRRDSRSPTGDPVMCINEHWLTKSLMSKIEQTCQNQLQSALARSKSIRASIRTFRTTF